MSGELPKIMERKNEIRFLQFTADKTSISSIGAGMEIRFILWKKQNSLKTGREKLDDPFEHEATEAGKILAPEKIEMRIAKNSKRRLRGMMLKMGRISALLQRSIAACEIDRQAIDAQQAY